MFIPVELQKNEVLSASNCRPVFGSHFLIKTMLRVKAEIAYYIVMYNLSLVFVYFGGKKVNNTVVVV